MPLVSEAFDRAFRDDRMAFMPFLTAGDPDLSMTSRMLLTLRDAGVDLIELGFPYSDPIADGPVIQASYTRALAHGVTVDGIFHMMRELRESRLPPVMAMVSFAIVFRHGTVGFVRRAADAGFSGLIVPDLPADEAADLSEQCRQHHLDLVQLIAPTTTSPRQRQILNLSSGFLYCISVAGTTGARQELPPELVGQLRQLRAETPLPLAVGFGISGPDQVKALEGVADGVIVGSAMVRRIASAGTEETAVTDVQSFARQMQEAVARVRPSRAGSRGDGRR